MLFYIWYFCTGFFFPFHLYNLFYDEGGDVEGIEAGGKVRISKDPARGIFGAQREPGPHILEHTGKWEDWKFSETTSPVADKHQLC